MNGKPLTPARSQQFWIFQFVGWSVWVSMLILRDLIIVPPEYIFPRALVFGFSAITAIAVTTGLRYLYRLVWERGFVLRFLVVWFGSLGAALLWQPLQNFIALLPFGEILNLRNASAQDLLDGLFSRAFPLMLLWSGLYFLIKYYQLLQEEKEKSLRSEALAHEAQLLMLRYQLNPHFLFNTLNAISTLVLSKATDQANAMIIKLSKFLRYSLDHSPLDKVSLAQELETSRLYLDIQKVRFGESLILVFDIEKDVEQAMVPTMLLQPIIENSIKHGVSKSESGGTITISVQRDGDKLVLEVRDDGPGVVDIQRVDATFDLSKGVGISNIRNRLQGIYGEEHSLTFSNAQPSGLIVRVVIPYETK